MHRLFVYGTLKRGEPNHHLLGGATSVGQVSTVPGFVLLDLGSYPALSPEGRSAVHGELYRVSDEILDRLDAFEGHPTLYVRTQIRLADGKPAWAYLYPDPPGPHLRRIRGGVW